MIVYYCATGYKDLNVINGNEKGTELERQNISNNKELEFQMNKYKGNRNNVVILDNTTGDYYARDKYVLN